MRDEERPPVTAHLQFQQHKNSFRGLSLQERFEKINQTNLWNAETSVSGLGSEDEATSVLRTELPQLFEQLDVSSLLDAPCGDASWISKINSSMKYTGIDIVPSIIDTLQQKSNQGEIDGTFLHLDITRDSLPKTDAILCRDCLVHFSFETIQNTITNFKKSGSTYLITTTFPEWQTNTDIENGDWRALNFENHPFNWGNPIIKLNEGCEEADGGYRDKSLGVWKLNDLP